MQREKRHIAPFANNFAIMELAAHLCRETDSHFAAGKEFEIDATAISLEDLANTNP
jgi:hypothetical protein